MILDKEVFDFLNNIDWMGISQEDIDQIKYEITEWNSDYTKLQKYRKINGEDTGVSFIEKLNMWIGDRIQMALNK